MKANTSKIYHMTIYLRLSKEDGDVAEGSRLESNSISNQKDLIMDFVGKHPEIIFIPYGWMMDTAVLTLIVEFPTDVK